MIFNVARGVFHSFSTRHQFYTFTKLKSFPRFLSSLQLFLFFRFLLFFSSHLPCPTLFARDPILFSPTGNTILTRSEVQLTMEDRSSHFSRKIHRERLKKCHCFGKYIYGTIQSQWIDISCCDLAYIAFQWVVNYIGVKRTFYFGKM